MPNAFCVLCLHKYGKQHAKVDNELMLPNFYLDFV